MYYVAIVFFCQFCDIAKVVTIHAYEDACSQIWLQGEHGSNLRENILLIFWLPT
jgi:hypothetical protein